MNQDELFELIAQAARRWIAAVNHWGQLGPWAFHVCKDPQRLGEEIAAIAAAPGE